jgi:exodeoxyribonuclease VII large subunit
MSLPLSYPDTPFPLTITQLSVYVKQYIEKGFSSVHVQGEISGCKHHGSGHIYFSLKDEGAVLDAICWRGTRLSVPLKDGMLVHCKGRITTYGARSKYQIIIESAEPAGQGALLQMIEALKAKLTQEGLFDVSRKKSVPPFPHSIGLITSATGAVIQDMLSRFQNRFPCRLLLYPVNVQGQSTVSDVLRALKHFHESAIRPDLIIIARGGGSIEDLWAFHDETLVRAVANSQIPIISAIGHETDTTLIDYAADVRAPTPTAAAEIALPLVEDLFAHIDSLVKNLKRTLIHYHDIGAASFDGLDRRWKGCATFYWPLEQKLDDLEERLHLALKRLVIQREHQWALAVRSLGKGPGHDLSRYDQHVRSAFRILAQHVKTKMDNQLALVMGYKRLLGQLSYQRTLERGFALVFDPQGQVCFSQERGRAQSVLTVKFHDGILPVVPLPVSEEKA